MENKHTTRTIAIHHGSYMYIYSCIMLHVLYIHAYKVKYSTQSYMHMHMYIQYMYMYSSHAHVHTYMYMHTYIHMCMYNVYMHAHVPRQLSWLSSLNEEHMYRVHGIKSTCTMYNVCACTVNKALKTDS